MPRISVIIPVYNVAPYISQCLESVASQTFTDFEAILVDDCGDDESVSIVETFIQKYNGSIIFRLIHRECNGGLSAARNTGLSLAKGEYVYFLDSDDTIAPTCLDVLLSSIEQDPRIEMAIGDVEVIGYNTDWDLLKMRSGIYDTELWAYYYNRRYYIPVWNKMIRRSFLETNHLTFEEGLIHEDYLWSFKAACHLKCVSVAEVVTYCYLRRDGSLDMATDKWLHNEHYSKACALQAEYALSLPGFWHKKSVFEYVEKFRFKLLKETLDDGREDIFARRYEMIRQYPYWRSIVLWIRGCTKGEVLRQLHRYLPKRLGRNYYRYIMLKYGL